MPDVLLIATSTWNRLSPADRERVQVAARESVVLQRRLWARAEREALAAITAAGVEVHRPEKEAFATRVRPLLDEALQDEELGPIVEKILRLDREHQP